jgi:hypothetical protein
VQGAMESLHRERSYMKREEELKAEFSSFFFDPSKSQG